MKGTIVAKKEYPPNIKEIRKHFKLKEGVVFTYGKTIYNPSGSFIDPSLFHHEWIHTKQQGDDPKGWWDRYLKDERFRLDQELEAYRGQYKTAKKLLGDRNVAHKFLVKIARDLSSELYGNIISFDDAMREIKK